MRSGTSCFDLTVYRKTVNRFWPLWAVNLVIWLFILPLNGLMTLADYLDGSRTGDSMIRFARNVGDYATEWGVIFAVAAGLAVAMAVCSHLYNHRSANFMGSLPIRREGQFLSTYLAGLTILVGPNLLIFLLALLVEAAGGAVMWVPLLFWLAALCAMEFFFYSFAVFLGQFAGHILALPVYYGIFNFIVIAVYALLEWVMGAYYFGYSGQADYEGWVLWCTPAVALFQVDIDVYQEEGSALWHVDVEGLWVAGVYAIAAVVLTACALLLYRRRHMETAGDIVAVKAMRPVFRYGVGFCAGMFLGLLTDQILSVGQLGMMVAIIVWGIIGCFVAQMLLDKTVRVFGKWKGCAALTAVFLLIFAVIGLDLTGYETRIPDPAAVESVEVSGLSGYPHDTGSNLNITLTDPESIEAVVALHGKVVEFGEEGEPDENGNYTHFKNLRLTYTLRSWAKISRRYSVNLGPELMALTQNLRDLDEVRYKTYELDRLEEFVASGGTLDRTLIYRDGYNDVELWAENGRALWEAVMTDFANGNIGIHAMDTKEAEYFEKYGITEVGDIRYTATSIEFIWRRDIPRDELQAHDGGGAQYRHIQIQVMENSVETLRVLEGLLGTDNRYQDDPSDNPLWRTE